MVSESQERMLAVVEPAKVAEVLAICERWQTGAAEIGEVTDGGLIRVLRGDEVVGDMPVEALVDGCPLYDLEPARARRLDLRQPGDARPRRRARRRPCSPCSPPPASPRSAGPSSSTTRWSARAPRGARSPPTPRCWRSPRPRRAIAVSIDGNGRRVACDPYAGTVEAVLECAQNLACAGAEPLGLTNCLNFGNPEKPAPAWQLDRAVSGLADACEALGVPVVGGNVSLYNEGPEGPIYPTPVVAMVGELPDPRGRRAQRLRRGGRRDRPARSVRPLARRLGAGQAARRARPRPSRARRRRGRRRLRDAARRGPRGRALLRPRRQRRRPRLRACRVRDRLRARLQGRPLATAGARLLPRGGPVRRGDGGLRASAEIPMRWRRSALR